MTMAMPVCLASRVSCAAHSRTCDTEPGAAVSSPLYSVWIESITATVGFCSDTAAWIASSRISANRLTLPVARPSRRARSATCSADSSPVTYSTEVVSDRDASACSSSVDLPMPGSPPISTTAPATRPPPSTRSNSSRPVGWRGVSRASISTGCAPDCCWPAAHTGGPPPTGGRLHGFLQRVPGIAVRAFALPLRGAAAFGANVDGSILCHPQSLPISLPCLALAATACGRFRVTNQHGCPGLVHGSFNRLSKTTRIRETGARYKKLTAGFCKSRIIRRSHATTIRRPLRCRRPVLVRAQWRNRRVIAGRLSRTPH